MPLIPGLRPQMVQTPAMNRAELIQRKEEVGAEIAALRRRLSAAQGGGRDARRAGELEQQLQALMAEEHRLRLLIDRSR